MEEKNTGMIANYMMVDDATLDILVELNGEELLDKIDELEELGENEMFCMDKLWDGMHFLLTGVSASKPIEGNHLSEAIIGVHVFDTDEDVFVSCSEYNELPDIVATLQEVDMEKQKEKFKTSVFKKAKIYPDIWVHKDKESLWQELLAEYNGVLSFYQKAEDMNMHVIISIY